MRLGGGGERDGAASEADLWAADGADLAGGDAGRAGAGKEGGNVCRSAGDEVARLVLAEEPFGGGEARVGFEPDAGAGGERHLGGGDGEAAIGEVVGGGQETVGLERADELAG